MKQYKPSTIFASPNRGIDVDADSLELANAINHWKSVTGRVYPNWSELIRILKALGWTKP